jgi:anti-sigma factor RsiW
MNCRELRECVAPLLDGELEPALVEQASAHMDQCPECAALVERLAAVPLRPVEVRAPANPEFWDAMDDALAAEAERSPGPVERLRGWFATELEISRGAVLVYLLLLGLAFAWSLARPDPVQLPQVENVKQLQEAPSPVSPAPRQGQRLEKASYAPVQQTF